MDNRGTFKIRFNTDYPAASPYKWRVLEVNNSWLERLCHEVIICTPTWTTTDRLPIGIIKHHITTVCNNVVFEKEELSEESPVLKSGYKKITLLP